MKIKNRIILSLILSTLSCKEYEDTISYPSPDGKNIIEVTTELQLSNDPDPFWQHISLKSDSINEPILPGNVYCLPFYEKPQVNWINQDSVVIKFTGYVGESFKSSDAKSKTINQISINTIIENNK